MKTRLITAVISAVAILSGFQSLKASEPSGFSAGVTSSVSLKRDACYGNFWGVGLNAGYRYDFMPRFYVLPEIGIEYNRYSLNSIWIGGPLPQQNYNTLGTYLAANVGFEVGKGWSFFTGPQLRYTYTGDFDRDMNDVGNEVISFLRMHKNQVSGQWGFGINKNFGRIYANVRFDLQMTKLTTRYNNKDQNFFRFAVGWNF